MTQATIKKIIKFTFGLLLSWLLLAAGPTHADVTAICNVGGTPSTHANFALALADSSCATINISGVITITGSHTITRDLEIIGLSSWAGGPAVTFDGENNGRINLMSCTHRLHPLL